MKKELFKYSDDLVSDRFLKDVVRILGLGKDFIFLKETQHTKVKVGDFQMAKLKDLCDKNFAYRLKFNEINEIEDKAERKNVNWSYEVILDYFNLNI